MNQMNTMQAAMRLRLFAGGLAVLLTACGGGGDSPAPEAAAAPQSQTGEVPVAALASSEALVQYVLSLPEQDDQEPLALGALAPPVSDSEDPVAL